MFLRESGSTDTDSIGNACLMESDRIHLSFDNDNALFFGNGTFREMESIKNCTLVENIRNWRVEVFWLTLSSDASCKSDRMSCEVRNRENNTSVEFVPSWSDENPGIDDILFSKSFVFESSEKLARVSGIPELESVDGFNGNATIQEIGELFCIFFTLDFLVIEIGGDSVHIVYVTCFFSSFLIIIGFEFHSRFFCKDMECFGKFYFLDFHKEPDWASSVMTGETIGEILDWRYGERWSFLRMKRAERLIINPCFLHLQISPSKLDDIDFGFYFL